MRVVLAHGGVGPWQQAALSSALSGLSTALRVGVGILEAGGSGLDACEAVVQALEDDLQFNAGTGSVPNRAGYCEMDACLVDGWTGQSGACASVQQLRHPIALARLVLEHTDHMLMVGPGAEALAHEWGLERVGAGAPHAPGLPRRSDEPRSDGAHEGGTVGCVALDADGRLVAATSTGGVVGKLPGRVGDTPVLGAGTYATRFAAASATGLGEAIAASFLTKQVCDLIEQDYPPEAACRRALDQLVSRTGSRDAGVIALARSGEVGFAQASGAMPVAYWTEGMPAPRVRAGSV